MKAKKSYGQHFLINENLARNIAEAAMELADRYPILEIGPGKGVLTKYLYGKTLRFKAVEADLDMVEYLYETFPGIDLHIVYDDILKLDLKKIFEEEYILFGNFPYNISSRILFKMIDNRQKIPVMIGMFQKEVAERIIAVPGNKQYGILSVLVQAYYTGKIIFKVKPGSFSPPPKVDSAVIVLERKDGFVLDCNESLFKTVVKSTFGKRRKMIRNTLKSLVKDSDVLKDDFFTKRPEQLSLENFVELTNKIEPFIAFK